MNINTQTDVKPKIITIASHGGHWIQLLRVVSSLESEGFELVYVSTLAILQPLLNGHKYYTIRNFSRRDFYMLIPMFFKILSIFLKERPKAVITTGAAPGIVAIIVARLLGKKAIWIDSIANVQRMSLSGKTASFFASKTYTQWASLADKKVIYKGNVFGTI